MSSRPSINWAVRGAVAVVCCMLMAIFVLITGLMVFEYGDLATTILRQYPQWFFYPPIFGGVTLVGFYLAACVFVDLYLSHATFGALRFVLGLMCIGGLSYAITLHLQAYNAAALWNLSPQALESDVSRCAAGVDRCGRVALLIALEDLHRANESRTNMRPFIRRCTTDALQDAPASDFVNKYCFSAGLRLNEVDCCVSQQRFSTAIRQLSSRAEARSITSRALQVAMPVYVFFQISVLTLAVLLLFWQPSLKIKYSAYERNIERGSLLGVISMLMFTILILSSERSNAVLVGDSGARNVELSIFAIANAGIAVALALAYYKRGEREAVRAVAQMGTIVAATYFAVNLDAIIDFFMRHLGSGGSPLAFALTAVAALSAVPLVYGWSRRKAP